MKTCPYCSRQLAGDICPAHGFIGVKGEASSLSMTATQGMIDTTVSASISSALPSGVIVMWSGAVSAIPTGWVLCDGGSGTPDLRGRFIVGAGGAYAVEASGGEETHALTSAELAAHTHTIDHDHGSVTSGGQSADHTHETPAHAHTANVKQMRGDLSGKDATSQYASGSRGRMLDVGDTNTEKGGAGTSGGASVGHTHSVDLPNHTGSSGSVGSGTAHENRPPYYALAYIMKL